MDHRGLIMQIQRTIQTLDTPRLVIDLPTSFVNQRVEILVIALDVNEPQLAQKRRVPPPSICRAGKRIRRCAVVSSL